MAATIASGEKPLDEVGERDKTHGLDWEDVHEGGRAHVLSRRRVTLRSSLENTQGRSNIYGSIWVHSDHGPYGPIWAHLVLHFLLFISWAEYGPILVH